MPEAGLSGLVCIVGSVLVDRESHGWSLSHLAVRLLTRLLKFLFVPPAWVWKE